VSWLHAGWPTFDPQQRQSIFPIASGSRPALRPNQPPIQWVREVLFRGWSAAGAWRWPLTPSGVDVKNEKELYFLSPLASAWWVARHFTFFERHAWRHDVLNLGMWWRWMASISSGYSAPVPTEQEADVPETIWPCWESNTDRAGCRQPLIQLVQPTSVVLK
jgi:hypothetical protein